MLQSHCFLWPVFEQQPVNPDSKENLAFIKRARLMRSRLSNRIAQLEGDPGIRD